MNTESKRREALRAMRAVEKGANVEEACKRAGVSVSVYYRHKRIKEARRAGATSKALTRAKPTYQVMEAQVIEQPAPSGKLMMIIGSAADLRAFIGRDL